MFLPRNLDIYNKCLQVILVFVQIQKYIYEFFFHKKKLVKHGFLFQDELKPLDQKSSTVISVF